MWFIFDLILDCSSTTLIMAFFPAHVKFGIWPGLKMSMPKISKILEWQNRWNTVIILIQDYFTMYILTHTLFTFFHFLIEGISSGLKFNSFYLKISNHLKGNLWALFHEKTYVAVLSADYIVWSRQDYDIQDYVQNGF